MADDDRKRKRRRRSPGAEIAASAREELANMIGLDVEGVTALEHDEDGTWRVTVEVLGYRRVRRYARSQVDHPQPARSQGK